MLNMWILYLLFCVFVPTLSRKEYPDLDIIPKEERKLLFELVKRLQKNNDDGAMYSDQHSRKLQTAPQQCGMTTNSSAIIKRSSSEKNGAKFLTLAKDVESNAACSKLCCENTSCDMAVYENKDGHYCYLFSCHDLCEFGYHESYMSNWIRHAHKDSHIAPEGSEQEVDLVGLGDEVEDTAAEESPPEESDIPSTSSSVQSIAPQMTTTTLTTTGSLNIRAHSVGLNGTCKDDVHCEDPNSVCQERRCYCRESFYEKNHICREVCTPSSFECLELGTHGRGPQCVAGTEVCDGTTNCADGSDEFNCPDRDTPYKTEPAHGLPSKLSKQGSISSSGGQEEKDDFSKSKEHAEPEKTADVDESSFNSSPSSATQSTITSSRTKSPATTVSTKSKPVEEDKQNKGSVPGKETKVSQGAKSGEAAVKASGADTSIFVTKEEMSISGITADKQGPIIALSLGLAFTLILLFFVACRLRTVRHRLRKGRPLHSNEADYLINGMYL